jgi:hypothetical protein
METKRISMLAFALAIAATAANAASTGSTTPAKSTTTQATHSTAPAHTQSAAPAKAAAPATYSAPAANDHLSAIKANLSQSRHNLRGYHWKETIVVNYKGEDKATMVNACVYDASGKLVRTPEPVPATASSGGMHTATANSKAAEIKAYEHSAVGLMRSYVPPDPAKLDKCKKSGKMSTEVIEDGQRVKLSFKDYQKPGDQMIFEVNPGTNQILNVRVDSYLASAKDAVKLDVNMASLPDGTSYPAKVKLDTPAKEMGLTATSSDYQKKTS